LALVCELLQHCVHGPQDVILETGDFVQQCFLVEEGRVQSEYYYLDTYLVVDAVLCQDSFFGIRSLMTADPPSDNTYRCLTFVKMLVIESEPLRLALRSFPPLQRQVHREVARSLWKMVLRTGKLQTSTSCVPEQIRKLTNLDFDVEQLGTLHEEEKEMEANSEYGSSDEERDSVILPAIASRRTSSIGSVGLARLQVENVRTQMSDAAAQKFSSRINNIEKKVGRIDTIEEKLNQIMSHLGVEKWASPSSRTRGNESMEFERKSSQVPSASASLKSIRRGTVQQKGAGNKSHTSLKAVMTAVRISRAFNGQGRSSVSGDIRRSIELLDEPTSPRENRRVSLTRQQSSSRLATAQAKRMSFTRQQSSSRLAALEKELDKSTRKNSTEKVLATMKDANEAAKIAPTD